MGGRLEGSHRCRVGNMLVFAPDDQGSNTGGVRIISALSFVYPRSIYVSWGKMTSFLLEWRVHEKVFDKLGKYIRARFVNN